MLKKLILLAVMPLIIQGCSTGGSHSSYQYRPNFDTNNVCSIYSKKPAWKKSVEKTYKKWGVPPHVTMAFIKQESNFRYNARPIRNGRQISSAFGFSQALDGTWKTYKRATGNWSHRRDNFDNATNFIGWYMNESYKKLKISKWAPDHQYLAYHEGWGGYKNRTYRKKKWLMPVANKVKDRAWIYSKQSKRC